MPCVYTRDEIIHTALKQAQLPNLTVHDMPDGVVLQDAFCIDWLQEILNMWYHIAPFSATVEELPITCTANSDKIILPHDFMLDVRNGLHIRRSPDDPESLRKVHRVPLQKFLNRKLHFQRTRDIKTPDFYCIVGDDGDILTQYQVMRITPTPTINAQGILWYYKLPPPLQANHKPKLPNDMLAIKYVYIRAHEWAGIYKPGTADEYCTKELQRMKGAGLLNEPEDDEIPFDDMVYTKRDEAYHSTYGWMGQR
jgi:hypothetical protein